MKPRKGVFRGWMHGSAESIGRQAALSPALWQEFRDVRWEHFYDYLQEPNGASITPR